MMKKKYTIIFLSIGFIGVMVGTYIDYKWVNRLYKEYHEITINTEIQSKVEDLYSYGGKEFVTLKTQKVPLSQAGNKLYSFKYPQEILSIGDSIVKYKNSDTLYLFHDNKKYWFKLSFE